MIVWRDDLARVRVARRHPVGPIRRCHPASRRRLGCWQLAQSAVSLYAGSPGRTRSVRFLPRVVGGSRGRDSSGPLSTLPGLLFVSFVFISFRSFPPVIFLLFLWVKFRVMRGCSDGVVNDRVKWSGSEPMNIDEVQHGRVVITALALRIIPCVYGRQMF